MCVHAENIVEAALCKSVLKPLREPIYQELEKLHTNDNSLKQLAHNQVGLDMQETTVHTLQYSTLIFILHGVCCCVCVCQSTVLGSTTTALGVTTAVPEAAAMERISIKLNNLHLEYSPQKKIELMLKACKIIYDSMSLSSPGQNPNVKF